jgi:hypothetical protein
MSEIEEEAVCRICRCGGSDDQPLFHPCRCRGSVRFVHEHCCLEWLRHNGQRQRCELCAAQLHFDPVYAVDAPQRLSAVELAVGLVARVLNVAVVVLHTAIALALWIVVLPMTVVAAFRYAVGGLPPDATASFSLLTVAYGGAIVIASIVVYILLVAFADLVALFYEETLLRFNEEDVVFDRAHANAAVADPHRRLHLRRHNRYKKVLMSILKWMKTTTTMTTTPSTTITPTTPPMITNMLMYHRLNR